MTSDSRAVSPVIAVILMVAVTVVLSAVIGAFVFDLGQSTTSSNGRSIGVSTSQTETGLEVTVVTGESDELRILVNGEVSESISSPTAGSSTTVLGFEGDDVSIVSISNGEENVVTTTTISSPPSFQQGLIYYYPFEEGSGSTAYDTISSKDGTINGASWVGTGRVGGNSLGFDGTDDYVQLSDLGLSVSKSFTVSLWTRPQTTGTVQSTFGRYDGTDDVLLLQARGSNKWGWQLGHTGTASLIKISGGTVTKDWTHVVGVWDSSGKAQLYENGTLVAEINQTPNDFATANGPGIGARGGGSTFFNGTLDDVRIYDRALSEDEIQDLYDATK